MTVLETPDSLLSFRQTLSGSVGFVPTMGALHEGHISLIKKAKAENDHVIVSVFVNPTQFLAGEDFDRYPRRAEADSSACKKAGVDALFLPATGTLYASDEPAVTAPGIRGYILEGKIRPGHFDGVLTIVLKLLNLVSPTNAYFGKKDAQQVVLIREMVRRFFLPTQIVPCDTVRDKDGLALSSRNQYLSPGERQEALKLSQALRAAAHKINAGERDCDTIEAVMQLKMEGLAVDYAAITDRDLRDIPQIEIGNTLLLVAARVGQTRLIDNFWI